MGSSQRTKRDGEINHAPAHAHGGRGFIKQAKASQEIYAVRIVAKPAFSRFTASSKFSIDVA